MEHHPQTSGTDFLFTSFIPGVSREEGLFIAILKEGEWEAGFFCQGEQEG